MFTLTVRVSGKHSVKTERVQVEKYSIKNTLIADQKVKLEGGSGRTGGDVESFISSAPLIDFFNSTAGQHQHFLRQNLSLPIDYLG